MSSPNALPERFEISEDGQPAATEHPSGQERRNRDRRSFVTIAAGAIGAIVAAVPVLAGLRVFVDPLTRRARKRLAEDGAAEAAMIRVATMDAMPEVGKVYRFAVVTAREDKWSKYAPGPVGAVFLRRVSEDPSVKPIAFTSVCPHLGCSVDFKGDQFKCPCHNSTWKISGERIHPESCPSPRDLDTLEVHIQGNDVFVAYKRFRGGVAEKVEA